ncbi:MAG: hypothetical protein QGD92_09915 [Gammaproteobacteria bacterium]|nr:hypothetical protein [Gammaproteobacteria bacterium]
MFSISLNIDPEKLKDADTKNKTNKKGAKKTRKSRAAKTTASSKDADS